MRLCSGGAEYCQSFPDEAVQTKYCQIEKCTAGSDLVKTVSADLRTKLNVDDRQQSFLELN